MTAHPTDREPAAKRPDIASREWQGPWRRYDIVKEGVIAIVVVSILTVLLAGLFSSPDEPPLTLFLGDGSALDDAATAAHLQGNTWGMMNETGSYPGQAWLWLYSFLVPAPAIQLGLVTPVTGPTSRP